MRIATLTTLSLLIACGGEESAPTPEAADAPHAVPNYEDTKADNYISTNAREFDLTGAVHLQLDEGFATLGAEAKQMRLDGKAQQRLSTVNYAIKRHIEAVLSEANTTSDGTRLSGDDVRWFTFFKRNNRNYETVEIIDDTTARFTFEIELVGSVYLMSKLAPGQATHRTFEVEVQGEDAPVTVEIKGSESRDAFPKYNELFADGVYDIAMHFGGDYNEGRFDLETAKWTVQVLLESGWHNESVTDFASLTIDSPPFTQQLFVEGREVEARVRVFHSDMVEASEESKLSDAMKRSFAEADVVLYSGHAGPGAGFILDYQPRHEISTRDFATLPLATKYQIYVFDGCQTYRTYVDDLLENPNKSYDNLDIVTTVNTTPFTVGYQVIHELMNWLTITDQAGNHYPLSWKAILRGINTENFRSVHYGVHGIDADPELTPHASEGIACSPCTSDADCGAGGNMCLNYGTGAACGVACTTDTACGAGFRCARLFDDPDLFYLPKQCVRRDYTCQ